MKARWLLTALALLLVSSAVPASAKTAGPPSVLHLPLWTVKGRPTTQFVPGLTAALLLTTAQQEQLARAWQETMGSETVAAAARTLKLDPVATEAQKQAAQSVIAAASDNLQLRIATILTMEQKALIEWINSVYTEVGSVVRSEMEPEYAAAKGDKAATAQLQQKAQEKREAAFLQKLKEILSPEQWAAMLKAAEEEKRAAGAGGKGKGEKIKLKAPSPEAEGKKKDEQQLQLQPPSP